MSVVAGEYFAYKAAVQQEQKEKQEERRTRARLDGSTIVNLENLAYRVVRDRMEGQ